MLQLTVKCLTNFGAYYSLETQNLRLLRNILLQHSLQQIRGTAVLKRKTPVPPFKLLEDYRKKLLRQNDFIYELIEETNCSKKKPIEVLLTQPVEDLGLPGDIVEVAPYYARDHLLLPGFAVYASPENREKYAHLRTQHTLDIPSSRFAHKTQKFLEAKVFCVTMNLDKPWQVEPWHVRIGFRRGGVVLPDRALTLPSQPITGPDMNLEGKEFLVKVKINNKEEAKVRFRVHHVAMFPQSNREPDMKEDFWRYRAEPIFEVESEILAELNNKDPELIDEEEE